MKKGSSYILIGVFGLVGVLGLLFIIFPFLGLASFSSHTNSISVSTAVQGTTYNWGFEVNNAKDTISEQVTIKNDNVIEIDNVQGESVIKIVVKDANGKKVFSEKQKGSGTLQFQAAAGPATIEITLNKGNYISSVTLNPEK
ncbi:hypothetical protein [Bacillus kwashiorkori]|uniref:hypothetical protein n=1 Tax=Bacillus kwashiorkori TaxID=1522318 RepID=UPI0007852963|nr:hypothetical protein [Bacillus kwashiorkori]